MRTATPKKPVYFYECTASCQRLFYFLPHVELKRLAKKERVRSSLVADFPDGVEIEISPEETSDFEEEYGIRLKPDPYSLWLAFRAILLNVRDRGSVRGLGYIDARFVEAVAVLVSPLRHGGDDSEAVPPQGHPTLPAIRRRWERNDRRDEKLRALRIPGLEPRRRLADQEFCRVPLYKGESPLTTCLRLHQTKGTANAARSNR